MFRGRSAAARRERVPRVMTVAVNLRRQAACPPIQSAKPINTA